MVKRGDILTEAEQLLHQLLPQVSLLLKPDVLLKADQLLPPQIITTDSSHIIAYIISKGFFIKLGLFLKVLQILVQLLDLLHNGSVLFIENSYFFH